MIRAIQRAAACVAVLIATAGQVQAGVITQTNSTDGFFDSSNGTRDFTFSLGDFGGGSTTVSDVNLSIFFAKSNNNSFVLEGSAISSGTPYFNEIEFVLTSPFGTSFTLISNDSNTELVPADSHQTFNSGSNGFKGTILFDQAAANAVDMDLDMITAGTFRPDDNTLNSLDIFNGQSALGTWSLFIEDDVGSDGLSFYEASLTITTSSVSAVPEPSSLALFGIGACIAGFGAARRRRREKTQAR